MKKQREAKMDSRGEAEGGGEDEGREKSTQKKDTSGGKLWER